MSLEQQVVEVEMDADDIDGTFVPRPRSEVAWVEIDGEAVLLVEGTWKTHLLNPTGTVVWGCLDGTVSLDELSDELATAFGADPEVVREDTLNLAREFGRAGLFEGVAEVEHQHEHEYLPPSGLDIGTELTPFELPSLHGGTVDREDLKGRRILLVKWSPHCGFCARIAGELAEMQPHLTRQGVDIVLLALGGAEENRELLVNHNLDCTVLLHEGGEVEGFEALGTPSAYVIDETGRVASELTIGADRVPGLARIAAGLN